VDQKLQASQNLIFVKVYIFHILTTSYEVPSWSRSQYSPDLWH